MNHNFLTQLDFLQTVFKESFLAVIPYLLLSSFIILVAETANIYHLQIGIVNQHNLQKISHIMNGFFSFILLTSLAFHIAKRNNINIIISITLSLLVFITIKAFYIPYQKTEEIFPQSLSFLVIFIPFISAVVLNKLMLLSNKFFNYSLNDVQLNNIFRHIIPFILAYFILVIFNIIARELIISFSPFSLSNVFQFSENFLFFIRTILNSLFWFIGLHGDYIADSIFGRDLLKHELFTNLNYNQFYDLFVVQGGAGSGIPLIIAVLISAKDKQSHYIAKLAIPFVIFNINEILIFGLPIIFNRHLLIPFLLVPLTNLFVAYSFLSISSTTFSGQAFSWITPIFINASIATEGDVSVITLQVFLIILGTLIYCPFIRKYTLTQSHSEQLRKLTEKFDINTFLGAGEGIANHKRQSVNIQSNDQYETILKYLNDNKLVIYYQPKININTNTCNHFEALLRLELSNGKVVEPYFLKNIEEIGLASIIDLWVCVGVNKDIEKWQQNKFKPQISINLHSSTVSNNDTINQIMSILNKKNIDFEILEHRNKNSDNAKKNLMMIRNLGFTLSIDNFGAGYSSLFTLAQQSYDYLKIDKCLIDLIRTPEGYSICKTITNLCNQMGITAIAEGVETKEQLDLVRKMGVQYVQGQYFSIALKAMKLEKYSLHFKAKNKK